MPDEPKINLATTIASEVKLLWDKARIPTIPENRCSKRIVEAIDMWMNENRQPEKRLADDFQAKLEQLMDLKPKPSGRGGNEDRELAYLKELMKSTGKQKKTGFSMQNDGEDWETDYNFYVDQYKVRKISLSQYTLGPFM